MRGSNTRAQQPHTMERKSESVSTRLPMISRSLSSPSPLHSHLPILRRLPEYPSPGDGLEVVNCFKVLQESLRGVVQAGVKYSGVVATTKLRDKQINKDPSKPRGRKGFQTKVTGTGDVNVSDALYREPWKLIHETIQWLRLLTTLDRPTSA